MGVDRIHLNSLSETNLVRTLLIRLATFCVSRQQHGCERSNYCHLNSVQPSQRFTNCKSWLSEINNVYGKANKKKQYIENRYRYSQSAYSLIIPILTLRMGCTTIKIEHGLKIIINWETIIHVVACTNLNYHTIGEIEFRLARLTFVGGFKHDQAKFGSSKNCNALWGYWFHLIMYHFWGIVSLTHTKLHHGLL